MTSNPLYTLRHVHQWERAPKGPASVFVGGLILGGMGITAGAFVTGLVGWLNITAVTSWALSALMPKPKLNTNSLSGLVTNTREAAAPHQIVYGRVRKGGNITFMKTTGEKNKYLHMVLVLAAHEVAAIDDIYIDDAKVTWNSSTGIVTTSEWKSKIRIRKFLGNQTTASSELVSECGVSSTFVGNSIAYLYIRMEYDQSVFANGIPTFTAIVRGKKVYDPSTGTSAYSNNAALCILDYLYESYGLNSKAFPNSINDASIILAKTICAQTVTTNIGIETRYPCNVVLSTESTPRENISDLLGSCGGTLFWGQGTWQLKVGSYTTPVEDFVLDDLRDSIQIATKSSRKENYNTVSGTFCDENQDWITVDYPVVKSSVFIAEDNGEENALTADFPAITSPAHAQRMALQALLRSREQITFKSRFSLKAMKVQPGDNITLSINRYGWSAKPFEVVSWNLVFEEDTGLSVEMTLKETSSDAFDVNGDLSTISSNNTILPNPRTGLVITGLAVTSSNTIQADGTSVTKSTLSWTGPTDNLVSYYTVQWKKSTDTVWFSTTTSEESLDLNNLDPGSLYDYRVSVTTVAGFTSSWYTTTGTPVLDSTAPAVPTSITAKGGYGFIQLDWTNPTVADFSHVEIYYNTSSSTTGRTLLGKSTGTFFVHSNLPSLVARYYWIRSVDYTGNSSGFTAVVSATTTGVASEDIMGQIIGDTIANGSITLAKFASDLEPIKNVTSIPSTKVTSTISYNGELYRWNGTAYVKTVQAVDVSGQLNSSQIADNAITNAKLGPLAVQAANIANSAITETKINNSAITAPKIAANAVVADKIAANAVTAGKIAANAVTAGTIAANAITAGKIAANAITSASIQAGAINADHLAANAVTASKMFIGDTTNLVQDSDYLDGANMWALSGSGSIEFSEDTNPRVGTLTKVSARVTHNGDGTSNYSGVVQTNLAFGVAKQFVEYFYTGEAFVNGAAIVIHRIVWYNGTTQLSYTDVSLTRSAGGWYTFTNTVEAPANTTAFKVAAYIRRDSTATTLVLGKCRLTTKATGELIVDGVITSLKLATGAVTAGKVDTASFSASGLAVFGGTLQSSNFNPATGTGWQLTQSGSLTIPNASITSAKIGYLEVGTSNIANNAMTNLDIAELAAVSNGSSYFERLSKTITASVGDKVLVTVGYTLEASTGSGSGTFLAGASGRVVVNNTVMYTESTEYSNTASWSETKNCQFSRAFSVTSTGNFTASIQTKGYSSGSLSLSTTTDMYINLLLIKK